MVRRTKPGVPYALSRTRDRRWTHDSVPVADEMAGLMHLVRTRAPPSAGAGEMAAERTWSLAAELVDVEVDSLVLVIPVLVLMVLMALTVALDLATDGRLKDVVCRVESVLLGGCCHFLCFEAVVELLRLGVLAVLLA